jgi:folate-binding protein YgfZ
MSNWQHFLDAQGATRSANGEIAFNKQQDSASQAAANTYLTELGYQGLLAFDGPDAAKFLQGQVTADVRELANGYWKLGAQCNLKGRMEASFALAQTNPEQILLRCHASLTDSLAQHLQKYAVFSKVTLSDASDTWRRFGLWGPGAAELVAAHGKRPTMNTGDAHSNDGLVCLKLDEQRYELWVSDAHAQDLWQKLASNCALADSHWWQLEDIRAGWAEITATSAGDFSPHELHYPLIGAVSFKKGCYTGQEVVARLHYKGKLKKHMARIALSAETLDLTAAIVDSAGTRRGALVMASPIGDNNWEALAVIPDDDTAELFLATGDTGQPATKIARMSLPYPLPTADNNPEG